MSSQFESNSAAGADDIRKTIPAFASPLTLLKPLGYTAEAGDNNTSPNMNTSVVPDIPAMCVQEGLDCRVCTSSSARELAKACPGLPEKLVTRLFVQIHTDAACAPMHSNFARAYIEANRAAAEDNDLNGMKKSMGVCRTMAASAAA